MPDIGFGYCEAWPDDMKELSRRHYRAQLRVRNLEAYITRVDPDEFDAVMTELENTKAEAVSLAMEFTRCNWKWTAEQCYTEAQRATQA